MKLQLPWPRRPAATELPVPDGYVMFWPTGRCPFRCLHCDLPILSQKRDELSQEEIVAFFSRSQVLRELPISIAGGEPFIRRDMVEILDFLTGRGHPVFVTSNGWYLEQMRRLAQIGRPDLLTVGISIDGVGATHDAIRRKGSFERVTQAIEIVRSAGCAVQINTVVQPENLETIEEIAAYFQGLGVNQVFIPLAKFPNMPEDHLAPKHYPDDTLTRIARWANSQPTDAQYVLSRGEFVIRDCHAGSTSCYIDPAGDVYACMTAKEWSGLTDYRMGNLREAGLDFDAIWASERAWDVRRRVRSCDGCYTGCEVSRETKQHGWGGVLDAPTLKKLGAPSSMRLDAPTSTPFLIGEWYWREVGFRWMGAEAGLRLSHPAGADCVRAEVQVFHPDLEARPVTLTVRLNGDIIGRETFGPDRLGEILNLSWPISPRPAADLTELSLSIDRVWVPREFGQSADSRRLGLVVRTLGFDA